MEWGWDILWFIIGVSLLVTVHEFGHFWVARRLGFKVLRFSVGFGKPLLKKIGRAPDYTEYVVAAVPLGGYVRMLDERDGEVPPEDLPRAFTRKPPWQRIVVMLAGPAANILFAIVVLWGVFWIVGDTGLKPVVDSVTVGSPAANAGLRPGDEIRVIDGTKIVDQRDAMLGLLDAISDDGEAMIEVRGRDGTERALTLSVPDPNRRHKLTEPNELFPGLGLELWIPRMPAILGVVDAGGPADKAGLRVGDLVTSVDGIAVKSFNEFSNYVRARPGQEVLVTVRRDGAELSRRIKTESTVSEGKTIGRLMVTISMEHAPPIPAEMQTHISPGLFSALGAAVAKSWQMTQAQAKFFVRMLTGKVSTKNLSSIITIAGYAGDAASAGTGNFLMFLVLISLSLGFLNLLPIPILDGGQVLFQLAEWAKGKPLSERTYMVGQQAGLLLLVLLMGVALFNDLSGIFAAHS
jgi:regulator of sigma E protease